MARTTSSSLLLTVYMSMRPSVYVAGIGIDHQNFRVDGGLQTIHASPAVRPPADAQRLLLCNAFVHNSSLLVSLGSTGESVALLRYKECRDLRLPLGDGDQLRFSVGHAGVGTFAVAHLTDASHTLGLIVHRRTMNSMAAAFKSHAFGRDAAGTAQVAVVDARIGARRSNSSGVEITEAGGNGAEGSPEHSQRLPADTVVAVKPGEYVLAAHPGPAAPSILPHFTPAASSCYVVIRVGDTADRVHQFGEDVVVFPRSAARRVASVLSGAILALVAAVHASGM